MKNLKPVEQQSRVLEVTINSNASRIIDKLKREIGELTEEQKYNQGVRNVLGLNGVQVPLFTTASVRESIS
jgi:hypothetical protein